MYTFEGTKLQIFIYIIVFKSAHCIAISIPEICLCPNKNPYSQKREIGMKK